MCSAQFICLQQSDSNINYHPPLTIITQQERKNNQYKIKRSNDPSAGSPTDTLLRLLLPLNDTI